MRKLMICIMTGVVFFFCRILPVQAEEPIIVVIDPGHGGENLGAEYEKYTEKYMTMIVANAMKNELEKYEGITVYLTRENDKELTLKERAEYAVSVNADYLFCLHFNMSVNHNLFGAEVWISAFGEKYQRGYTFADIEMNMLEDMGLYSRGIKTKLNDKGTDYYGILREAEALDLTAVLIEHCHLDQENDKAFYSSKEALEALGVLDATAVAKYYGLKSDILGVDYSNYQKAEIPIPVEAVKPDTTEPDVCMIEVTDVDESTGDITVELSAADYDSYMLYYAYSFDGGQTFSGLQKWEPKESDTLHFTINAPSGSMLDLVVRAYNGFDGFTDSNHVALPSMSYGLKEAVEAVNMTGVQEAQPEYKDITPDMATIEDEKDSGREIDTMYFLQVSGICVSIVFVLFLVIKLVVSGRSKKKRRRRK